MPIFRCSSSHSRGIHSIPLFCFEAYKAGMHEAVFFCFSAGQGGAEETNFGVGQGRAGSKILGAGRVTVKLGAFLGWGGAGRGSIENFRDRGSLFSRSRAGRTALQPFSH